MELDQLEGKSCSSVPPAFMVPKHQFFTSPVHMSFSPEYWITTSWGAALGAKISPVGVYEVRFRARPGEGVSSEVRGLERVASDPPLQV